MFNLNALFFEEPSDLNSNFQAWVTGAVQIGTAYVAYHGLNQAASWAEMGWSKLSDMAYKASTYRVRPQPDEAHRPQASAGTAFWSGAKNLVLFFGGELAKKVLFWGGLAAIVVQVPNLLNSEPMRQLRALGIAGWLTQYAPGIAESYEILTELNFAQLGAAWNRLNQMGVDYTTSLYQHPVDWAIWGVTNAAGMSWSFAGRPLMSFGKGCLDACTRKIVSVCSNGWLSAEGLESYFEGAAALIVLEELYRHRNQLVHLFNINQNYNQAVGNVVNVYRDCADPNFDTHFGNYKGNGLR